MERTYTHTLWVVRPSQAEEFVRRWREWADWSHEAGLQPHATLLRDADDPSIHVSFGRWSSAGAAQDWRLLSGYADRVSELGRLVDHFEPRTLTVVTES